ncbi:MAG: HAMP domain-containing protein [Euryarchaeota archaeon]|nr:HAMP domain-containing protein [Euryarchaeota archaeon]
MRLSNRLLLALFLTALVPLAFGLVVGYGNARAALESSVESGLGSVADVQASRYGGFMESVRGAWSSVAEDERVRAAYADHRAGPNETTEARLDHLLGLVVETAPRVTDISLIDGDGRIAASTVPDLVGIDVTAGGLLEDLEQRPELRFARFGDSPDIWLVGNVSEAPGAPASLAMHIERTVFDQWGGSFPDRGVSGEVLFMLRDTSDVPHALAPSRLDPSIGFASPVHHDDGPVALAFAGATGILDGVEDSRGVPVVAAVRTLDDDVVLVVKMDRDEAFRPVTDLEVQAVAGVFTFIAVLGGTAVWVSFTVSRPLVRLTRRAARVADGRHDLRIFPAGDEELRTMAASMNRLAARLDEAERTLVERVRSATAELRRSNQELEQFAYIASHDLKEPIRMVRSYLDLIERRFPDRVEDDLKVFLGYAKDGAERMQRLVDDLLVFSRVGRRRRPHRPVELDEVMEVVVRDLSVLIQESRAEVSWRALPVVKGDRSQLVQLLENLVSNAIKFHGEEAPRVVVEAVDLVDAWRVMVHDNGIGIEPEYQDRIFEIFQRLDPGNVPGTGIGLAVCQKIVERHEGRIGVESVPGEGSTFWFTLPKEHEEEDEEAPEEAPEETFRRRVEELV